MAPAKSFDLLPLSLEERERLLSVLNSESDKIMLRLLLETGRPLEDLLGAKVSDLDSDRDLLRLRKEERGGDEAENEEIPLSPELMKTLIEHLNTHPGKVYLFEGRCGKPVGPKWIRCAIEPAAEKLGLALRLGDVCAAGTDSATDRK
ncbi:MAG TPA: site-specific integrase [Methanotrichaceae archaeon]|nr:site-specific integrase [Methanotrichaceae archaeon]